MIFAANAATSIGACVFFARLSPFNAGRSFRARYFAAGGWLRFVVRALRGLRIGRTFPSLGHPFIARLAVLMFQGCVCDAIGASPFTVGFRRTVVRFSPDVLRVFL